MKHKKTKEEFLREYFSIPNLLGYFRLLLIPIYLYVYLNADSSRDYFLAAFIMFLSFLSDFLDGKIARHFSMITEFGKILDPIADKITQGTLALGFAFRYPAVLVLFILFLCKECIMGVLGILMMRRGYRMNGAQMHGKICTAILDFTMLILLLFPVISPSVLYALTGICILSMGISLGLYLRMYYHAWTDRRTVK